MLPSETLFLDRDDAYWDKRTRYTAYALYDAVHAQVEYDLGGGHEPAGMKFPKVPKDQTETQDLLTKWHIVAEVAEGYPKLLVWISQGQVSGLRNVFGPLVAVARIVPGVQRILWGRMFAKVADRAPWRPALYEAIKQHYLRFEKDETGVSADNTVRLSSSTNVAVPIPTSARYDLRSKILHMSSGCIGVSGLRGSGKSTVIRDLCQHRYGTPVNRPADDSGDLLRGLRLVIPAPVRFSAREFVIHLYSCLCEAVLADPWFNRPSFSGNVLGPILLADSGRLVALFAILCSVVFLGVAAELGYLADTRHWWVPSWIITDRGEWWACVGAGVLLLIALIIVGRRTRNGVLEVRQVIHLAVDAKNRLRQLHYQRTWTMSHGGSLSGPAGAGISVGTSRQFAEQAMTLPELIHDYRDFTERVAAALYVKETERAQRERERAKRERRKRNKAEEGQDNRAATGQCDVRLIIGIDEMDHIAEAQEACQFLDEISALFGTTSCVYLVAVSPDALAAIDRRAVPPKASSGALFDEMVWIDALHYGEAVNFLKSWVTEPIQGSMPALCYVLSGGLPRELARIARAVFGGPEPLAAREFGQIARRVTNEEIDAFAHRAMASAASLDSDVAANLLAPLDERLRELTNGGLGSNEGELPDQGELIKKLMLQTRRLWKGLPAENATTTSEIVRSFIANLYFLLTVRQVFESCEKAVSKLCELPKPQTPGGDSRAREEDPSALRDLVDARAALSVSPYLAVDLVNAARDKLSADSVSDTLNDPAMTLSSRFVHLPGMSGDRRGTTSARDVGSAFPVAGRRRHRR